jgi:hypothetical protein
LVIISFDGANDEETSKYFEIVYVTKRINYMRPNSGVVCQGKSREKREKIDDSSNIRKQHKGQIFNLDTDDKL